MNSNFSNHFARVLFVTLLVGGGQIKAQPTKPKVNPDQEILFTCVEWDRLPIEPLFYRNGKTPTPLTLRTLRRSVPYKLEAETRFDLLTTETLPDGSTGYKIVGSAPIPDGSKRVMFLLEPKPQQKPGDLPLDIVAVEDSLERFPAGTFRFVNVTAAPLRIEFGGTVASPAPGETVLIKPRAKEAGFYPIRIFDAANKVIFQSQFFWEPVVREYVVVKPATGAGAMKLALRFISEVVEPQPPAAAQPTPAR